VDDCFSELDDQLKFAFQHIQWIDFFTLKAVQEGTQKLVSALKEITAKNPPKGKAAKDVFVSYKHEEKDFAFAVVDHLEGNGFSVWIDKQGIDAGNDWRQEIMDGIEHAMVLVFIESPDSVDSKFCREELEWAYKHDRRVIRLKFRPAQVKSAVSILLGKAQPIECYSPSDRPRAFGELVTILRDMRRDPDKFRAKIFPEGTFPYDRARINLEVFAQDLEMEGIAFDDNNNVILGIDDEFSLHLTYQPDRSLLYLYSPLLDEKIDDVNVSNALYQRLLEGAILGKDFLGGGVGVDASGLILAHCSLDMKTADSHTLKSFAPKFVSIVEVWRKVIRGIVNGTADSELKTTETGEAQATLVSFARAYMEGNSVEAETSLRSALQGSPGDLCVRFLQAFFVHQSGSTSIAQEQLLAILRLDPAIFERVRDLAAFKGYSSFFTRDEVRSFMLDFARAWVTDGGRVPRDQMPLLVNALHYLEKVSTDSALKRSLVDYLISQAPSVDLLLRRARFLEKDGKPAEAQADVEAAAALAPGDPQAVIATAAKFRELGNLSRAQEVYLNGLQRSPQSPLLHFTVAKFFQDQGRLDEAVRELTEALRIAPKYAEALELRAFIHLGAGRVQDALTDAVAALIQNNRLLLAHYAKIMVLKDLHKLPEASEAAEQMVRVLPQAGWSYYCRSEVNRAKRDYGRQLADVTKCLELTPANTDAHRSLGQWYFDRKDFESAQKAWRQGLDLSPTDSGLLNNTNVIALYEGRAGEYHRQLLQNRTSESAFILANLATSFAWLGSFAESCAYSQKAAQLNSQLPPAQRRGFQEETAGIALYLQEARAEAAPYFQRAEALYTQETRDGLDRNLELRKARLYALLCAVNPEVRALREGATFLENWIEIEGWKAGARFRGVVLSERFLQGLIYHRLGDVDQARRTFADFRERSGGFFTVGDVILSRVL